MSDRPVLISLRGHPGSGKTSLLQTMRRGQAHLVQVPLLQEAMRAGFAFWDPLHAEGVKSERLELAQALREVCGAQRYLVGDDVASLGQLLEAAGGRCDVAMVFLVAPLWLLRARRAWRYARYFASPEERLALDIGPTPELMDDFEALQQEHPEVRVVYIDARDYPVQQVSAAAARALACDPPAALPAAPGRGDYHPGLLLHGKLWGCQDEATERLARQRLEAVLPEDLGGCTVLDIGAGTGLFAWEALHRGAAYVVAVEQDQRCVEFLRRVREHEQLPLSVCALDAAREELPAWYAHERLVRYDLALLLNVLHWCERPEELLARTLAVCEECVIETPFAPGTAPRLDETTPWPGLRCLPPQWLEAQAAAQGFRVVAMRTSPIYPGYRIIMRLRREVSP